MSLFFRAFSVVSEYGVWRHLQKTVCEKVKKRPVIVISPARNELTTVVCLSTVEPTPLMKYHLKLPQKSLPKDKFFQGKETWVKGDMVYAVGFHRLDKIRIGKCAQTGKRLYFNQRFGRETMKEIYSCVLHSLNLGHITEHV